MSHRQGESRGQAMVAVETDFWTEFLWAIWNIIGATAGVVSEFYPWLT
jgi:hypothetical protein